MIELTEQQLRQVDGAPPPVIATDPRSGKEYVLIQRETYEKVRRFLTPLGRGWDNRTDDDLIRKQPS